MRRTSEPGPLQTVRDWERASALGIKPDPRFKRKLHTRSSRLPARRQARLHSLDDGNADAQFPGDLLHPPVVLQQGRGDLPFLLRRDPLAADRTAGPGAVKAGPLQSGPDPLDDPDAVLLRPAHRSICNH
jgi:hypothetical protein